MPTDDDLLKPGEIKRRREALGRTVAECADLAKFKYRQQWGEIEGNAAHNVSLRTLFLIAGALGCTPADLIADRKVPRRTAGK